MTGLIFCGLIAIGSTAVALGKASGKNYIGAGLGLDHPVWVGFMVASAVLAFDLTGRVFMRGWRFSRRINREGAIESREL